MSSQKGNIKRTRPQKYKNATSYKNNLHDTSKKTKEINKLEVSEVCKQCKDVIEWKIKYKKYKPLTQPKTCSQCHMKSIKFAYHTLCDPCGRKLNLCCKCRQPKEIIRKPLQIKPKEEILAMMNQGLKTLPERRRRTFYRYVNTFYDPIARKKAVFKNCPIDKNEEELKNEAEYIEVEEGEKYNDDKEIYQDDDDDPRLGYLSDDIYCENYMEKIRQKLEDLLKVDGGKDLSNPSEFDSSSDESDCR